jgi:hypothetical protein
MAMKLTHKALDFQVRQVGNPEDRILEFIGSTADVDRYGDIIEVEGWDLKHYQKNPQFLWAHNYSVPPVGTTRKVAKADGTLSFQVYFPKDEEVNVAGWPSHVPTPETVYKLYLGGFLRATSVGFQGLEWEPILGEPDEQGYRPRTGTKYTKQDLYELSAVPVPANPYALMNAVQKGVISQEQVKAFEDFKVDPPAGYKDPSISAHTAAESADDNPWLDIDDRLKALGYPAIPSYKDGEKEEKYHFANVIATLCDRIESQQTKISELELKAGAVLSAKNKTALKNAQAMIQQVLDASEPADDSGKSAEAPENQSIYSLALNPGEQPHGERQAGEAEEAEAGAEIEELRTLTQNLHLTVCKS